MTLYNKLSYIFSKKQKTKFAAILMLTFGGAVMETLGITMIMPLISVSINSDYIFQQPILAYIYDFLNIRNENHLLIFLACVLILIYITKTIYLFVMYKIQYKFVFNNQRRLSIRLMTCYLKKPYEYYANKNSSEIIQAVTQDVTNFFNLISKMLLFITEILIVLSISFTLIIIDPLMVMIIVVLLTSIMLVSMKFYRKSLKEAGIENRTSYKDMIKWVSQGIGGIKEIKVLKREQFFIDEYSKSTAKYTEAQKKYSFLGQVPRLFIESICICTVLIVFSVTIFVYGDISLMIPKLSVFAMAALRIMPSFNRINTYYNNIIFYKPSLDLIYKDLKDNENNKDSEAEINKDKEISLIFGDEIIVENISYKYPNTDIEILLNVSFEIPIKKSIALVGTSGAGKTTFADIFLGLLKPIDGEISINGVDIHKNESEWSKKLGYIPQNIYLCDDTIRKNVAFGIAESEIDEEKIYTSLEKAQLVEFIKTLPLGINTEIGERGIRLSGGQRQRIGIARAFYNDPEIFVMDEATSALDNDTESAVMEAIYAIKGKKTLIIIAHRLSTIQNCDLILKVEDGRIKLQKNSETIIL